MGEFPNACWSSQTRTGHIFFTTAFAIQSTVSLGLPTFPNVGQCPFGCAPQAVPGVAGCANLGRSRFYPERHPQDYKTRERKTVGAEEVFNPFSFEAFLVAPFHDETLALIQVRGIWQGLPIMALSFMSFWYSREMAAIGPRGTTAPSPAAALRASPKRRFGGQLSAISSQTGSQIFKNASSLHSLFLLRGKPSVWGSIAMLSSKSALAHRPVH